MKTELQIAAASADHSQIIPGWGRRSKRGGPDFFHKAYGGIL